VQAVLWRYFDLISYIMYFHGAGRGKQALTPEKPMPTISLMEMRVFVRRTALTSPYLNLAQIEMLVPSSDGKRRNTHEALHDPEGQVTLPELMESLVRIAISRQHDPNQPEKTLPTALVEMIDTQVQPAYAREPPPDTPSVYDDEVLYSPMLGLGEFKVKPLPELNGAVGRVLRIGSPTSRSVMALFGLRDQTRQTLSVHEFVRMCVHARLLAPSPSGLGRRELEQTMLSRCADSRAMLMARVPCHLLALVSCSLATATCVRVLYAQHRPGARVCVGCPRRRFGRGHRRLDPATCDG
jgi:hypothetical protein